MGDATHNKLQNNIMNAFQNSGKRQRVQFENPEVTPTPSNTSTNGALSAVPSMIEVPQLQLEGNSFDTESRETVVDTFAERENLKLAYKVDNLKDKQIRYESHVSFLQKCLDNNITPMGLRVYCEPSIGNRDEDFLEKWHNQLTECSKALINITIEWSKNTIQKTKTEIQTTSDKLKESVPAPTFKDIETSLAKNQETRTNELIHRKNRKFYKLKYGDKEATPPPSNNRTNEIVNNRGHRGMADRGQQERNRGDENIKSDRRFDRPRAHNDDHRYVNNYSYTNSRVDDKYENRSRENRNARNDHYNNKHDDRVEPIHRRLLERNRSVRDNTDKGDYPPLRKDRPREDPARNDEHDERVLAAIDKRTYAGTVRGPRARAVERDPKDMEIDALRNKVREMENERNGNERVLNHYSSDTSTKNGDGAQAGPSKTNRSPEEMQTYIQEALRVICGFAESFNTQPDPTRTHTDK